MAEWPISINRAAKRLDIPYTTACILVRTHDLEVVSSDSGVNFKGLMPEAYEQLREKAKPFRRSRQPEAALSA